MVRASGGGGVGERSEASAGGLAVGAEGSVNSELNKIHKWQRKENNTDLSAIANLHLPKC